MFSNKICAHSKILEHLKNSTFMYTCTYIEDMIDQLICNKIFVTVLQLCPDVETLQIVIQVA